MPCTEIASIPLIPGTQIGDPSHEGAAVMKEACDTLAKANGHQTHSFGTWVESPNQLQMIIDWDARQSHHDFEASASYPAFRQRLMGIMDGPPDLTHVDFEPAGGLQRALAAPVTEVATFFFDGAPSPEYISGLKDFVEKAKDAKAEGFFDLAAGVTYEELEYEGVKGKAVKLIIGWQSVEAHMAFRETEKFKELIPLLRNGIKGAEVHHVAFMSNRGD